MERCVSVPRLHAFAPRCAYGPVRRSVQKLSLVVKKMGPSVCYLHDKVVRAFDVSLFREAAHNHDVEFRELFTREKYRRSRETQLEVSSCRFSQFLSVARLGEKIASQRITYLLTGDKVQQVVHELESDAQIASVLESRFLHTLIGTREQSDGFARVGNETGCLLETLVDVVREALTLILLRTHLHELALHQIQQDLRSSGMSQARNGRARDVPVRGRR